MRTTINLDDELLEEAGRLTGVKGRTALVHERRRVVTPLTGRPSTKRNHTSSNSDANYP